MEGKLRIVLVEISAGDQALQEALRTFAVTMTEPRPPVIEPTNGAATEVRLAAREPVLLPALPAPRKKRKDAGLPKTAGRGAGTLSPVQDLCLAALKNRPMSSSGVHNWAQNKSGKTILAGSVYNALAALKKHGQIELHDDDAAGQKTWRLTGVA